MTLTINRPARRNAVTAAGWEALRNAFQDIDPRTDRVLVLTGAGETFCSGADLDSDGQGRSDMENMQIVAEACLKLFHLPIPTIACVDGAAVGAGMNLALACDFVVATDRSRWSQLFVKRALSVDFGGSWVLPRLVGLAIAKRLVMLGDFIDPIELHRIGVVHEVMPAAELESYVKELSSRLAAHPQMAMSRSKALLNEAFERGLATALDEESAAQAANLESADAAEAARAFLERREPRFTT